MTSMSAFEVLEAAASAVGVDASRAVLMRSGTNAMFRLPGEIVARVGAPATYPSAVSELRIALWLNRSDFSAVQAVESLDQPILVADRPVTWWRLIPDHRAATPGELGGVLRRLHALTPPTEFQLPDYQPFARIEERITESGLGIDDKSWLLCHLGTLRRRYGQLPASSAKSVIHGDAWQGNVAVPRSGSPVLLDLDNVSLGNPEWDLVPLAVDHHDFDRLTASDYRSFVDAYGGRDLMTAPEFRVYADIQELRWTAFAIGLAVKSRKARHEAGHRIACLRGAVPKPWKWDAL